jgi:hypothetical protein
MSFFFKCHKYNVAITKRKILVLISNLLKKMLKFSSQKRYRPKTFVESSTSKSEQLQFSITFRDTFFALHFFAHI